MNSYPFEVSFVIPCLNEQNTLKKTIEFCKEAIAQLYTKCEIIVADNGSTDASIQIAESLGTRVVHVAEIGYGNALIHGIRQSAGKYIVMGDADATYDFSESVAFIECLRKNEADFIIGSRLKGNIEAKAMPILHRYLGTPVLSLLIRWLFKLKISDCNCGMRAFTKSAFTKMQLISGGMEFASEMLIKASIMNLRVKEIPCSLLRDTRGRPPHLKTWRDGWKHLKFILAFAPNYVFYYPSIALMSLGGSIWSLVSLGRVHIGHVDFDYNFMYVGALLFFSGYQLFWLKKFDTFYVYCTGYLNSPTPPVFNFDRFASISGITVLVGIILSISSLVRWSSANFYANPTTIRILISAITCLLFGTLTFTNALLIAMMNLKICKPQIAAS